MISKLPLLVLFLSVIVAAANNNPYADVTWTKTNVPNGCFPDEKNRIVCEDYKDANNRSITITDPAKNMMYVYIKKDGIASTFNAAHCNDLMAVPTDNDDEAANALLAGNVEKYIEILKKSMSIGKWGWNCNGSRTIKNVFCMLNGKKTHYAKISKYDEMGILDSEKETTAHSIIGDFCRDIFDGI